MFSTSFLENILFLDIETASLTENYESLPERLKEHWAKKSKQLQAKEEKAMPPEDFFPQRAAIYSEFGQVVTISCGMLRFKNNIPTFRLKSFFGGDEKSILAGFYTMLESAVQKNKDLVLCAHNGKEFDFPYLGRRFAINRMHIPGPLQVQGKKPWEVNFIDTMDLWKFGDYKSYTSLDLLTAVLDIPSPKDDMDGSEVGRVFWKEKNYSKIKTYCEKDVIATAQVVLQLSLLPLIKDENIEFA